MGQYSEKIESLVCILLTKRVKICEAKAHRAEGTDRMNYESQKLKKQNLHEEIVHGPLKYELITVVLFWLNWN